jgi:hypothetical protein
VSESRVRVTFFECLYRILDVLRLCSINTHRQVRTLYCNDILLCVLKPSFIVPSGI